MFEDYVNEEESDKKKKKEDYSDNSL